MELPIVYSVCSYKRCDIFKTHTYKVLYDNKLTDNLYIWVVNQEEKDNYEKALEGLPYKAINIRCNGEPELWKAYGAISAFFPENQRIVWLEDKIQLIEVLPDNTIVQNPTNLQEYVDDGFETIKRLSLGCFTFNGSSTKRPNLLFLKNLPRKQVKFTLVAGSLSGFINHHNLFRLTEFNIHCDTMLSLRYYERYQGILKYNWYFYSAKWNKVPGGFQGECSRPRLTITKENGDHLYATDPLVQKYCSGVVYNKPNDLYVLKFKRIKCSIHIDELYPVRARSPEIQRQDG